MSRVNLPSSNFSDCLTIGEAAEFLGVSAATLRNWDRSGKLKPRRHPQNGYRIYLHEDLAVVLQSAELSVRDNSPAPQVDWSKMGDAEHFVQFYESEQYLIESVRGYIGAALCGGDCALVVATKEHRYDIERKLAATGADLIELETTGRYVFSGRGRVAIPVHGRWNARRKLVRKTSWPRAGANDRERSARARVR